MAERFIHHGVRSKDQGRATSYVKKAGYKAGGAVHGDEAADKNLIAKMIRDDDAKDAKSKRAKRKRGGFVPGQDVVGRLDKKPRGAKSAEQVYATPGRTDVQKPKITAAPASPPKRASGGSVPKSVAGPQNHNGMGKLANLGSYAHGGKIKKREGGGDVGGGSDIEPGVTPPRSPRPEDVMTLPPPSPRPGGGFLGSGSGGNGKFLGVGPTGGSIRGGVGEGRSLRNMQANGEGPDMSRLARLREGISAAAPTGKSTVFGEDGPSGGLMPFAVEDRKRGGKVQKRASGGRVKAPRVNVIINTGGKPAGDDPAKAILPALLAAKAGGAGAPPPGMPPMPPPGMPPMGGPPPGLPGGAPPPMMRKAGGRIPEAKLGPATIPMPKKITVRGYERRKGGKVC